MAQNQDAVKQMVDQGWDFINEEAYEAAKEIGTRLIDQGSETGYRIYAMALAMEEDPEGAMAKIQEGLAKYPKEWQLHLQLGNFLSDAEQFPEAMAAFEQALACEGAETHWVEMNKAVVFFRMGEVDEALNTLQLIKHPEVRNDAFALKLNILQNIGRSDLVLELTDEELESLEQPTDEQSAAVMAQIMAQIANAYWFEEAGEEATLFYLRQAIEFDRTNEDALWLLREMKTEFSDSALMTALAVSGKMTPEEGEAPVDFFCTYFVIADSEEEALEMIKAFEIEAVDKTSLKILESETAPNEDDDPKGIYMAGELTIDLPDPVA